ncbi:MAG: hypothetical protein A3K19_04130 [Lentisphaerae bacterium RIFOXYB12_FULL_65_16]|nr:MAG: hypothetical protein A3K18_08255 [Lentisphaerae bacterium RIFOXYA12_64_32]OGV84274.1 MAG: hypothetical protein A3K19_04130 [Lentisphaerae bacterium RIFOXYB12_FULL_65_16]
MTDEARAEDPGMARHAGPFPWSVRFWLFLAAFALYAGVGHKPGVNEVSRIGLTWGIVEWHSFTIDPVANETVDRSYCNGHYYSDKAPGVSFLAIPAFAVYRWVEPAVSWHIARLVDAASGEQGRLALEGLLRLVRVWVPRALTVSLAAAFFAVFMAEFLRRHCADMRMAGLLALGWAAGTMAYPYATVFYGHMVAAVALFVVFARMTRVAASGAETARRLDLFLDGLLLGVAVVTEFPTGLIATILGGYFLLGLGRAVQSRRLAWREVGVRFALFVGGGILPAIPLCFYNAVCFGHPLRLGYETLASPAFQARMREGFFGITAPQPDAMWGMTFGTYRGMFPVSPFLMLSLPALALVLWRVARRRESWASPCAVAALIVAVYFVFNAGYAFWFGGSAMGPRHFVPALPFLVFLMSCLSRRWWPVLAVTVAVSVAFMVVFSLTDPQVPERVLVPLWQYSLPQLQQGRTSVTVFHFLGLAGFVPVILYLLAPLTLMGIALWQLDRSPSPCRR